MGHGAAQLHDAAAVTAVANHLEDACGAQARMLIESLANEPNVRIDDGCAQWLCVVETFALDGVANRIGMNAQFTGNGADLPVFDVKVAANLRASFRTDHAEGSLSWWSAWKRIDEASDATADPAAQRQKQAGVSGQDCGVGDFSCGSAGPHSNDAGDVIEREP